MDLLKKASINNIDDFHTDKQRKGVVTVLLTMPGCHHCQVMKQQMVDSPIDYNAIGLYLLEKTDKNSQKEQDFLSQLGIRGFPHTCFIFGPFSATTDAFYADQPISQWLKYFLSKFDDDLSELYDVYMNDDSFLEGKKYPLRVQSQINRPFTLFYLASLILQIIADDLPKEEGGWIKGSRDHMDDVMVYLQQQGLVHSDFESFVEMIQKMIDNKMITSKDAHNFYHQAFLAQLRPFITEGVDLSKIKGGIQSRMQQRNKQNVDTKQITKKLNDKFSKKSSLGLPVHHYPDGPHPIFPDQPKRNAHAGHEHFQFLGREQVNEIQINTQNKPHQKKKEIIITDEELKAPDVFVWRALIEKTLQQ